MIEVRYVLSVISWLGAHDIGAPVRRGCGLSGSFPCMVSSLMVMCSSLGSNMPGKPADWANDFSRKLTVSAFAIP